MIKQIKIQKTHLAQAMINYKMFAILNEKHG